MTTTLQLFLPSQNDALCEVEISDHIESALNLETGEVIDPATIPQDEYNHIERRAVERGRA
jgi:hypothetical protein